ncbi:MAG: M28 family peptidase [Fidelibacterota bacterium]|nr:MAG: M28 family peptidase [Candidatus Neomarinimicrobiota bacterium]
MRKLSMRSLALIIVLFYACATGPKPLEPSSRGPVAAEALLVHASYLAADSLFGRRAGTLHELRAAEYIRREFVRYGLEPAVPGFFQSFSFIDRIEMGPGNALSWALGGVNEHTKLQSDVDFRPLGFSASDQAEGGLVFAGYGISATEPEYDDYAGLDVTGKVVMLLRYSPDGTNPYGPFGEYSPLRKKVLEARERGAAAVIMVTGPADDDEDYLMNLRYDRGGYAGLPVVNLTRQAADRLLAFEHLTIAELQQEINATRLPLSHEVPGVNVSITTDLVPQETESRNVLAALPGTGSLKGQWVVLGAHYDHLGWGGLGSGSMEPNANAIHNGADDNASGTATLLELARYLATNPPTTAVALTADQSTGSPGQSMSKGGKTSPGNRRSIMFQAFGAEEVDLLGSAHVTKHPPVPIDSIVAMLNLDMIGSLAEGRLLIGGAGTTPLWKELLPVLNSDSLNLAYGDEGFGSSDHQSYYLKDKPVLFFSTGEHERYHRPSDDVEFLNFSGMVKVGQLVARVTEELTTRPEPPVFSRVVSSRPVTRRGLAVTLGTIPDHTWDGEGFRISGVRDGGPADKGGLKTGDVILRFGETEVQNIYDYMYVLQAAKAGVPVAILVKRGAEELELEVVPERRRD